MQRLILVVALSMVLTPALFVLYEKIIAPRAVRGSDRPADAIDEKGVVVVAGMGRFGQIVTRLLIANSYPVVILDHDPETVENVRKYGMRTYYGDATRPDLLHSAGLHDARVFIAALEDRDRQTLMVEHVARTYPHVRILARAADRHHVYDLEGAGAHVVERELFEGALALGKTALTELGAHPFKAENQARAFRRHDVFTLDALREKWHQGGADRSYIEAMRTHTEDLFEIMNSDRQELHDRKERGWTPPPKGDLQP
jgi:CPA2 family monovalent cation:H+ antiporter-2/glutathione-regulated potassium-efflux system ancillary protein KefC